MAIMVWLIGSKVGVMTAARMKATTMAYFLYLESHWGVTTPILAKKKITNGSSKTKPTVKRRVVTTEM